VGGASATSRPASVFNRGLSYCQKPNAGGFTQGPIAPTQLSFFPQGQVGLAEGDYSTGRSAVAVLSTNGPSCGGRRTYAGSPVLPAMRAILNAVV
jgi:hypothetical protein